MEMVLYRKERNTVLLKSVILSVILILVIPVVVFAEGPDLTEIFSTKAFQGSWDVVYQFNWLGGLMNYIISVFSLLGLFLVMYSRFISLLYLSSKNLWDNVNEVKGGMTGNFFGMPALFRDTFQAKSGGGLDSFISFFYGLLPNVKKYSDYNGNGNNGKLSEDDNALDYILKVAPSTIALVFCLTIGFSGTLGQAFGTVVGGMARFADNVVAINLDSYVDKIFQLGSNPDFTLGEDKSNMGKVQKSVAKAIYKEAISATGSVDSESKAKLAAASEQLARNYVTAENVGSKLGITLGTDKDWGRVKVSTKKSASSTGGDTTQVISMQEILPNYSGESYIHVIYSAGSVGENYFTQP